jgi:hypothetical protein
MVIHFAIYEDKDHHRVPLLCSPGSHGVTDSFAVRAEEDAPRNRKGCAIYAMRVVLF